jgi:hypothetical protein
MHDSAHIFIGHPQRGVDAVHSFEIAVPIIEAETCHATRVTNAEANIVYGEVY